MHFVRGFSLPQASSNCLIQETNVELQEGVKGSEDYPPRHRAYKEGGNWRRVGAALRRNITPDKNGLFSSALENEQEGRGKSFWGECTPHRKGSQPNAVLQSMEKIHFKSD